jgi:hypothetical protein
MLIPLLIQVHSPVYSCIHIDSDARHYLGSCFYLFWCTARCTAVFILILMHIRLLFLWILVHSPVYSCIHINSGTQHCVCSYFYRSPNTALCTSVFILNLVHNVVFTDSGTQVCVHLYWCTKVCIWMHMILKHNTTYVTIHTDHSTQLSIHLYS